MKRSAIHSTAFTLIELVLVLAMLTMVMALAAPSLRGWGHGSRLRNASDQLMTATRFARAQAISTAVVHRLEVDPSGTAFRVIPQDPEAAPPPAAYANPVQLPSGLAVQIERPDGAANTIDFHPNGRITPGVIRLLADWGETVVIQAQTPADSFRNVTAMAGGVQ